VRVGVRGGHLLVEALCALALSGVLATAAGLALGAARRSLASTERIARADRSSRETVAVVAGMMEQSDSIALEGDTAAALTVGIGVGAVCATVGRAIVLPPVEVSSGLPIMVRSQPLDVGDLVSVLMVDSVALGAYWIWTEVDSTTVVTAASPCGIAEGWMGAADAGAERTRLFLRDSLPTAMPPGAPVRIFRRGRLALYHDGSGEWMLGWRRCVTSGACGVVQPVAGPLRAPGGGGLRLSRDAVTGEITVEASGPDTRRPARLTVRPRDGA